MKLVGKWNHSRIDVAVFVGIDRDHLQLAGSLNLNVGEWQLFAAAIALGARATMGHLAVLVDDPLAVPNAS